MSKVILASKSPRRRELLTKQNIDFECFVPDADEKSVKSESPADLVRGISKLKAEKAAEALGNGKIIIAADTVVAIDGKVLGKPKDEKEAFEMLSTLSGRKHTVYTGLTVISGEKTVSRCVASDVYFREMTEKDILDYIASGEPMDKAGAYGIQEKGARFVKEIHGDFYSVMGLPICELFSVLYGELGLTAKDTEKEI